MADVNVGLGGWNSVTQSWGNGGWGEDVAFTGLTGSVGSVTVVEGSGVTVTVTGLAATSSVGSVTIATGVNVTATGLAGTSSVGRGYRCCHRKLCRFNRRQYHRNRWRRRIRRSYRRIGHCILRRGKRLECCRHITNTKLVRG